MSFRPIDSEPVTQLDPERAPADAFGAETPAPPLSRVRALLAKIRDLDLHASRIAVATGLNVSLLGCSTPDSAAGRPLRYRLSSCHGDEQLELRQRGSTLEIDRLNTEGQCVDTRLVALTGGDQGTLTAAEISARIDPEQAGPRDVERFLRRIVRSVFA